MEANTIRNAYYVVELPGSWAICPKQGWKYQQHQLIDDPSINQAYPTREAAERALGDAANLAYAGYLSSFMDAHRRSQMAASQGYDPLYGYAEERSGWEYR